MAVLYGGRSLPVRIHTPASGAVAGVHLQIHGGGFYLGSAAGDDVRNRNLADALGLAVVSLDYRLAPEHPWPAASDDCETAALWLAEHAEQLFGATKLSIGGFSAGATLAMTTLLRLRDRGIGAYGCAVLQFGPAAATALACRSPLRLPGPTPAPWTSTPPQGPAPGSWCGFRSNRQLAQTQPPTRACPTLSHTCDAAADTAKPALHSQHLLQSR